MKVRADRSSKPAGAEVLAPESVLHEPFKDSFLRMTSKVPERDSLLAYKLPRSCHRLEPSEEHLKIEKHVFCRFFHYLLGAFFIVFFERFLSSFWRCGRQAYKSVIQTSTL